MSPAESQTRDPTEEIVKGEDIPLCGNCISIIQGLARIQKRYPRASTVCPECKGIVKLKTS